MLKTKMEKRIIVAKRRNFRYNMRDDDMNERIFTDKSTGFDLL